MSHLRRFIFIKTRKTAGTSFEIALSRYAGPDDVVTPDTPEDDLVRLEWGGMAPQNRLVPRTRWGTKEWARWGLRRPDRVFYNHMPAKDIRRFVGHETWKSYFTFTIERNPWDLAVSAWAWYSIKRPCSFEKFVASNTLHHYANWRIYTIQNRIAVDFVIRYEQLAESLADVERRLDLPGPLSLPRAKGEARVDRRPYQAFYGRQERERVARVFRHEIRAFGWTFD